MRILIIAAVLLSLLACKSDKPSATVTSNNSEVNVGRYLLAMSNNVISVDEPIVLRFKNDIVAGHPEDVRGVTLSPKLKGEWSWSDEQTLVFNPDGLLDYNITYAVNVDMDQLLGGSTREDLNVQFQTLDPRLTLLIDPLHMDANGDKVEVVISGEIQSSDFVDSMEVKRMFKVNVGNQKTQVIWTHQNGRGHKYQVRQIAPEQETNVHLEWNGMNVDPKFKGEENITIEGIQKFSVADVVIGRQGSQHVKVVFSQPLHANRDYNGLVKIKGEKKDPRLSIKGNTLLVYPANRLEGDFQLLLDKRITSFSDVALDKEYGFDLSILPPKPQVRSLGGGMISSSAEGLKYSFEAINLDTIDLEIFKIYEDNMLQFLQDNNLAGMRDLQKVGRIVNQAKVPLNTIQRSGSSGEWKMYQLELDELLAGDNDGVYQIVIGFRPSYTDYVCDNHPMKGFYVAKNGRSINQYQSSYPEYSYSHRTNPCYPLYYSSHNFITKNILFSDVGAIVKKGGDKTYKVVTTKISDVAALGGVKVRLYDFQQQMIAESVTSATGFANIASETKAAFAICEHPDGVAYVRLFDGEALSVSDFDTGGKRSKSGIDGFIYKDRGVYRPGDTVHMHFMLTTGKDNPLPDDHPVTLKVKDARGKLVHTNVNTDHLDHIYTYKIPTDQNDPTGNWQAEVQVGSVSFYKNIKVETVKPNRLRIAVSTSDIIDYTNDKDREIDISSQWLHGASAKGLKAVIDADWSNYMPAAPVFREFKFSDPARKSDIGKLRIYEGELNNEGRAQFKLELDKNAVYPMMLKANTTARVYEKGGDFSENYSSIKVSPYSNYVGVKIPKNEWGYSSVKIGDPAKANAITTDLEGRPVAYRELSVGVYDINWRWWYYSGERYRIYDLNSAEHKKAIYKTTVTSGSNGRIEIDIPTEDLEYGRKMIRICDTASGHCTGDFFYASGWRSRMTEEERNSLTRLNFVSDKPKYTSDETIELSIPSEMGSKILISIEDDEKTIVQDWVDGEEGSTTYSFGANIDMAPNVYAHVMLIQPQKTATNDLPIRMYGVIPIKIENPASILKPEITTADKYEPEKDFVVTITEEDGKSMNYTIAIVDEGLLDLTNYNTPDPHASFYSKRSIGVKTWDMYDYVAYGQQGSPDAIISVGGDGENEEASGGKKAIRFKPVVFSAGPFKLEKGERRNHKFTMPNYIGSVRAMVIAKDDKAYGHTEETVPVKTPLMVLPTLPRVLSPEERVTVPASVFVMEDGIRNVNTTITTNELIRPVSTSDALSFQEQGEQMAYFDLNVNDRLGIGKIEVVAESGGHKSSQQVEMDIRNPMPVKTSVISKAIPPGEVWNIDYEVPGMSGGNNGIIELSQLPNLNLEDRMGGLIRYPYGCIEQTTSAVFPQLYLADMSDYISKDDIKRNINAGIKRISKMEYNGGFKYWPGSRRGAHEWGTSYAGHFLIEAMEQGYFVSQSMMARWVSHQKNKARNWKINGNEKSYELRYKYMNQAYRLYTLSLNSTPDLSAMNLLRVERDLPATAKFLLAAAYAYTSNTDVALQLIKEVNPNVNSYYSRGGTFGSDVRDMALIAQTMSALDRKTEAALLIKKIATKLSSTSWYSTQTTAQALLGIGKYIKENGADRIKAEVSLGDKNANTVEYDKSIFTYAFDPDEERTNSAMIKNTSKATLFASIQVSGRPAPSSVLTQSSSNSNVELSVSYTNLKGESIDISNLEQGTDFIGKINIRNLNTKGTLLEGMALTQIIPSGWEIRSGRLNAADNLKESAYDYRDVRDDRVHTFFDLRGTQTYAILLNATYAGEFFLPPVSVEAMYDKSVNATTKGKRVVVRKAGEGI